MEKKFGKYVVRAELGRGAMGIVYLAHDPVLDRDVAIKTISSSMNEQHLKERFIREARAAGKLTHPNLVTIYDFGDENNQLYIAMEYLKGQDLFSLIADKPPMDVKEKLEIVKEICLGLDYAHRNGVFHRDVKPANIHLEKGSHVKVVDFGLAVIQTSSLTRTGAILGTPSYTCPERLKGHAADGKADQFAVGIILYELLTYKRAFDGDSISTIIYKILNHNPPQLSPAMVSKYPEMREIIFKSVQKDPQKRFETMKDMADALDALILKMKKDGFVQTDPVPIEDAETVAETAVITPSTDMIRMKPRRVLPVVTLAVSILALTAVLYLIFRNNPATDTIPTGDDTTVQQTTTEPTGTTAAFFSFNAKPYGELLSITNDGNGETVPLAQETEKKITPLRMGLTPGNYTVRFTIGGNAAEVIERKITIGAGETVILMEPAKDEFLNKAIKHFSLPQNGGEPN